MIITFTNVIGAIRNAISSVITTNLKMWLGFETSEILGREEVLNGDFSDGTTGWLIGDGWDVTNNRLNVDTDYGSLFARQNSILEIGKTYVMTLDVSLDVGEIKFESGGAPNFIITTSDTTISHTFVATLADVVFRRNVVPTRGYIDNISIKELTQITPDKSGNNNVGELFTGKALDFDGSGDNVGIDFTTPIKSAVFWVKPLGTGIENILTFGGAFGGTKAIRSNNNVISTLGLSSVSIYVNGVQSSSVPLNQWSRVVVNFDLLTPTELRFGFAFNSYGDIQLSDVQLYNENLSTDDIAYDYANPQNLVTDRSGTSIELSNLKGYWHLSEGAGSLVYDSSGEGNNGTINGATYEPAQPRIPQLGMMNWSKGSNLVTHSEDFTNGSWTKLGNGTGDAAIVTSNFATSPIGTQNATRLQCDLNSGTTTADQSLIYDIDSSNTSQCISIYMKSNNGSNQNIYFANTFTGDNRDTAIVTTDWQRFEFKHTTANHTFSLGLRGGTGSDDIADILIWGAQSENSSSASAYRLTDGAATLNSTVIPNPTIPTQDILGNAVRDRLNSFNLDGSGYAEVADDADLDFGIGDFTLECWLRIDGNTDRRLLDKRNTTSGYTLYLTGSNVLKLELNDGTGNVGFDLTSSLNSNTWLHLAIVCDRSANATCYVNKAAQTPVSISSKNGNIDSTSNLIVGADAPDGLSLFSTDIISDVRLYKGKALTSDEVENNYNAGLSAHTN